MLTAVPFRTSRCVRLASARRLLSTKPEVSHSQKIPFPKREDAAKELSRWRTEPEIMVLGALVAVGCTFGVWKLSHYNMEPSKGPLNKIGIDGSKVLGIKPSDEALEHKPRADKA